MMDWSERRLGVCYYPEHWPEEVWPRDAARMAEAGLSLVRIGEFAWSRIEPEPGRLDWAWLDRAVEVLAGEGLRLVLGTPTATPPRWMVSRHPDMLPCGPDGAPRRFGSRRHYDFSHEGYRAEAVRIARLMGERYGTHEAVVAWQIDNEYGCHDTTLSWSPAASESFRRWLADRHGTVDRLNEAWGTVFWSMEYRDFAEIDPPHATVTEPNPAHVLDFRRHASDRVVAFNAAQADVLRPLSPGRTILHNYMGRETGFDHFRVGRDLDAASWDSYPLGFLEDRSGAPADRRRRFARAGEPDFQAFHHDLYRAVGRGGRWWVMEQQPGPVNWAPRNPAPAPGMVRLWTWEAFAHGAEAVCYFRWRQAPFGQEQMHAGLLRPDSEPAQALAEARRVADEIACLPRVGIGRADAALAFDYESAWAWQTQPQGADFDYTALVLSAYRALRRSGLSVDVLPPDLDGLADYPLALVPGLWRWSDAARANLAAATGTRVILGPRAGARTAEFRIPRGLPPDLRGLLDVRVASAESLRPDMPVAVGDRGALRLWREALEPGPGAVAGPAAADGGPAWVRQGPLIYLGGWPDDDLWASLLTEACAEAGLPVLTLPDGVRVRRAGRHVFVLNYGPETVDVGALGIEGRLLLGERTLAPADVIVLEAAGVGADGPDRNEAS
jgi:beta-galactosidase